MVTVHHHRDHDPRARERGARDSRVARSEGAHRVEDMRDASDPEIEGVVRLLGGRVRVSRRHCDAALAQARDEYVCPG